MNTTASKNSVKARSSLSPARKVCLWIIRVDVILMVVITVYALLSQNLSLLWIAFGLFGIFILTTIVSRVIWVREKLLKEASDHEAATKEQAVKG